MNELSQLYEKNFAAWAQRNAELLRSGRFGELDIGHLVKELGDMGKSERDELESRLAILLAHLLKWQFQYRQLSERWREFEERSWRATMIEQRNRIAKQLRRSMGLTSKLPEILAEAYPDAVDLAVDESGLSADTFPALCPYSIDQILDKNFYPESI